jgi:hypothetical protein
MRRTSSGAEMSPPGRGGSTSERPDRSIPVAPGIPPGTPSEAPGSPGSPRASKVSTSTPPGLTASVIRSGIVRGAVNDPGRSFGRRRPISEAVDRPGGGAGGWPGAWKMTGAAGSGGSFVNQTEAPTTAASATACSPIAAGREIARRLRGPSRDRESVPSNMDSSSRFPGNRRRGEVPGGAGFGSSPT